MGIAAGTAGWFGGVGAVAPFAGSAGERRHGKYAVRFGARLETVDYSVLAGCYERAVEADATVPAAFAAAQDATALDGLAARLARRASSPLEAVGAAQSLVARLDYVTDQDSTGNSEYIRHPTETLVDAEGDCDDKAVLLAALLSRPAFDSRTALVMPERHCATLVASPDLPSGDPGPDGLTVSLDGVPYAYLEAVGSVPPGDWAQDYGERPLLAAYRDHWHVLDGREILGSILRAGSDLDPSIVTRYL